MKFPQRLKESRKEHKLTQIQLGKILNYGYTAIANYESGRNQPNMNDLIKLANALNVSIDYLLGNSDIKYPQENNLWLEEIYKILKKNHIYLQKEDQLLIDLIHFNMKRTALQKYIYPQKVTEKDFDAVYSELIRESSQSLLKAILLLLQNQQYYDIIKQGILHELNT